MAVSGTKWRAIMKHGHLMLKRFAFIILAGLLAMPANAENLIGNKVVLRALDKVTATTEDFTVAVGESLRYGSLDIKVRHCEKKPPEETPETYAFMQILDSRKTANPNKDGSGEENEATKLFSGWMFASSPALSSLDHPVYDIWVLDCLIPPADALTDFEKSSSKNP